MCAGAKISHLTPGVDPRVGAPRADDVDLFLNETMQSFFDRSLDCRPVILALPAGIRRAFVFHHKLDIPERRHCAVGDPFPGSEAFVKREHDAVGTADRTEE